MQRMKYGVACARVLISRLNECSNCFETVVGLFEILLRPIVSFRICRHFSVLSLSSDLAPGVLLAFLTIVENIDVSTKSGSSS